MSQESQSTPTHVDAGVGIFWVIGWMFTIAFAHQSFWQALLGIIIWRRV